MRRSFGEKCSLAAIWVRATAIWKNCVELRSRVSRLLLRVPAVRRYLAEMHRLSVCPAQAINDRDRFQTVLREKEAELEVVVEERGSLLAERDQLQANAAVQCAILEGLTAERDHLRREIEQERTVSTAITKGHDALTQQYNVLAAGAAQWQRELEEAKNQVMVLNDERVEYQHLMLGRLATLQSQFGSLQGSLTRLSRVPDKSIVEEIQRSLYLDLLESSLIGTIIRDESVAPWSKGYDPTRRELGRDWPKFAFTMIGKARMRNLRQLTETILSEDVPGDLLEAGVWRGGACIYMRGILKAHGIHDRRVWVADSFAGLPPPSNNQYPADRGDAHYAQEPLAVSLQEVRDHFARYDLLDEQVRFLKGWFKDTLPNAPVEHLALLRLDGDMYESTIQTLDALYWKLSPRGFIIADDYILPACKQAVDDFRSLHGITTKLEAIDGAAIYWRKPSEEQKTAVLPNRRQGP